MKSQRGQSASIFIEVSFALLGDPSRSQLQPKIIDARTMLVYCVLALEAQVQYEDPFFLVASFRMRCLKDQGMPLVLLLAALSLAFNNRLHPSRIPQIQQFSTKEKCNLHGTYIHHTYF